MSATPGNECEDSTSKRVARLRDEGITWRQLGLYFGVSKQAVILWANGGRMPEWALELLERMEQTPITERFAVLDDERKRHSSKSTDINRGWEWQL